MGESETPAHEPGRGGASAFRDLAVLGALVLACVAGGAWWIGAAGGSGPKRGSTLVLGESRFVGSRTCAECHPGETALFSGSGHAKTLGHAGKRELAAWLDGRTATDGDHPTALWTYEARDGRLFAEHRDEGGGAAERFELEFAFGSGQHATTFISILAPDPAHPRALEHRLSYFAEGPRIDVTPGQRLSTGTPGCTPTGRSLSEFETRRCFECHATRTSTGNPEALELASLIPNVSCERCHGPGREHALAARRGANDLRMPFGQGRWTADEQSRLCGQCHRLPEFIPKHERTPENPVLVRFQTVGLLESRCYTESKGKSALSCTTCHDPHGRTSRDRAKYDGICRSCHEGPDRVACSVGKDDGCVACHMPRRESGQGMQFADHWIRRRP